MKNPSFRCPSATENIFKSAPQNLQRGVAPQDYVFMAPLQKEIAYRGKTSKFWRSQLQ